MKTIKKINHAGDTIIEVMVCLAILSMSLGISYETATAGLNQSRNSEQHSEAVGLLDAQVEELRTAISSKNAPPVGYFCMTASDTYSTTMNFPNDPNTLADDAQDNFSHYLTGTGGCVFDSDYYISINPDGTQYGYGVGATPATSPESNYTVSVRWSGIGGVGPQQVSTNYRIGELSTSLGDYILPLSTAAPPQYDYYTDSGAQYSHCAYGEGLFNDGADGCFPSTPVSSSLPSVEPMYAYRQVFVTYPFTGTSDSSTKPTTLTVNFEQYPGGGEAPTPPWQYTFQLLFCVVPPGYAPAPNSQAEDTNTAYFTAFPPKTGSEAETGPCYSNSTDETVSLPINNTSVLTEDTATNSLPITINNYQAGDSIEIDWLNNVTEDGDPNLQINSIILTQQNYP